MTFFRFNRLYIIESLEPDEVKTGQILFDFLQPVIGEADFPLPMGHYTTESAQGFRDVLAELLTNSQQGHVPWLHIECHGSDEGLEFANGSEISWQELCDLLRPINQACQFQLFVVLSCCHGAGIVSGIDTGRGAPCLGLIGPSHEVNPAELLGHFRDFYQQLIATTDLGTAFRSWSSRSLEKGQMAIVTAELWWRQLMSAYLAEHATRDGVAKTARRQRKIQAAQGVAASIGYLRRKFIQRLPLIVENRFKAYFMLDEVPANAARFGETFKAVQSEVKERLNS
ncbi:hypothetical protein ACSFBM_11545 [Variovorax sp. GB1R11]|uniref:hypothetical protein n=1 Tax=Variovorax sp. GB1R11 TaxID=3443741 RepID=UPI003F46F00D